MILLDTDVMIDVLRKHGPAVAWLRSLGAEPVGIPGLVAMELLQGCRNALEQRRVQVELERYKLFWPTESDSNRALRDFFDGHLSQGIGFIDTLIAGNRRRSLRSTGELQRQAPRHRMSAADFAALSPHLIGCQADRHAGRCRMESICAALPRSRLWIVRAWLDRLGQSFCCLEQLNKKGGYILFPNGSLRGHCCWGILLLATG